MDIGATLANRTATGRTRRKHGGAGSRYIYIYIMYVYLSNYLSIYTYIHIYIYIQIHRDVYYCMDIYGYIYTDIGAPLAHRVAACRTRREHGGAGSRYIYMYIVYVYLSN